MDFWNYDWADSDLDHIHIEYDRATLAIFNDTLQKKLFVECIGFAGITNLCIWDDTIILDTRLNPVCEPNDAFMRNVYAAYNTDEDYDGRSLRNGMMELRITLVNNISFSIYCQKVQVVEK